MATFDYNPITGQLDLVGSGGASYIDGVVANPTALPVTLGTPALDSVYLAKAGSGVWLINRRPAGLYCRVANNGNLNDWVALGAFPEVNADGNWELYNSADPTKELKFDLSGISTATTRTLTVPNASGTLGWLQSVSSITVSTDHQLTAARNQRVRVNSTASGSGASVYLPAANNAEGDRLEVACVGLTSGTLSVRTGQYDFTVSVSMGLNEQRTFIYTAGAWTVGTVESHTHAGLGPTFASSAFQVTEPSGIVTNRLAFSLSGLTAGSTRTLTVPNASGTIALTSDFAAPPAIGSTTANSGAFTTLSANNGTLTASAPVLDLSQTWNNAAVAFTGIRLNVTKTASANTSDLVNLQIGGVTQFRIRDNQLFLDQFTLSGLYSPSPTYIGSTGGLMCATHFAVGNNLDTILIRDGASGTLAQRNGLNPQTFRLYGQITGTDTSATGNYERGYMRWSAAGGTFQIGTEKGSGGGTARPLEFQTDGVTRMTIAATGAVTFSVGIVFQGGEFNNFVSFNHNVNIQGGGRQLQVTTIAAVSTMTLNSGGVIRWSTTNAFPSLRHSGTTLRVRLADDTDFAPLECAGLTLNGNLTASTRNIVTDTTTGTKIGTDPLQKIGFFDKTPVVRPSAVADATDAASVITQLNALLSRMRDLGLIAT